MKVLWLTSFNPRLYKFSGKRLIDTWNQRKVCGRLVVAAEGMDLPEENRVSTIRIDEDPILTEWLEKNADRIPKDLGGRSRGRRMTYWNRNASRWFRKVVALERVRRMWMDYDDFDILCWVDCDCTFVNDVTEENIQALFSKHKSAAVLYLKGPKREHPEVGFVAFHMRKNAATFIKYLHYRYASGRFIEDERWDDGAQYTPTILRSGVPSADIFKGYSGFKGVVEMSAVGKFLRHDKGRHKKMGTR